MNDLIERIEAASGPDRDIDLAIDLGARPDQWAQVCHDDPDSVPTQWCDDDELPRYTASLDAALTLVPEGVKFEIDGGVKNARARASLYPLWHANHVTVLAATPALALSAAALKARAYLKETNNAD